MAQMTRILDRDRLRVGSLVREPFLRWDSRDRADERTSERRSGLPALGARRSRRARSDAPKKPFLSRYRLRASFRLSMQNPAELSAVRHGIDVNAIDQNAAKRRFWAGE
jgi:hypothetical protein